MDRGKKRKIFNGIARDPATYYSLAVATATAGTGTAQLIGGAIGLVTTFGLNAYRHYRPYPKTPMGRLAGAELTPFLTFSGIMGGIAATNWWQQGPVSLTMALGLFVASNVLTALEKDPQWAQRFSPYQRLRILRDNPMLHRLTRPELILTAAIGCVADFAGAAWWMLALPFAGWGLSTFGYEGADALHKRVLRPVIKWTQTQTRSSLPARIGYAVDEYITPASDRYVARYIFALHSTAVGLNGIAKAAMGAPDLSTFLGHQYFWGGLANFIALGGNHNLARVFIDADRAQFEKQALRRIFAEQVRAVHMREYSGVHPDTGCGNLRDRLNTATACILYHEAPPKTSRAILVRTQRAVEAIEKERNYLQKRCCI